ncbi:MAG TPA: type II toxin-antitoxin system death-on-curing family toxin [Pseudogracilibacillus sp.]|nr:type II toxin-antitoxin system death-on-curing family toxin [Pseudogracilibacillus sp.]
MDNILYLNKDDILSAHSIGMTEFNGKLVGVSHSCVEKRVIEPQTKYFGQEQYPGLFKKAALYWYRITTSHCFTDGNKRAALISTDLFLKYNGYKINVNQESLFVYCLLIGNHKTRPLILEVESWLKRNTIKLDYAWKTT